jgi:hypothetical protein
MNGYNLSRWWFNFAFDKKEAKVQHTAIFMWCIELNNRLGWKSEFGIPTQDTMEGLSIGNKATYINALRDLHDWGFIEIIKESKNQYQACVIKICSEKCCNENATPLDSALIQHSTQHSNGIGSGTGVSTVPIDKQVNKQTKKQVNNNKQDFKNWTQKEFEQDILKNHGNHDHNMIREFRDYWIEMDGNGKMLFQFKKTWQTKLRLDRWKRMNYSSNPSFEKKTTGPTASPNTFSRASNGLQIK